MKMPHTEKSDKFIDNKITELKKEMNAFIHEKEAECKRGGTPAASICIYVKTFIQNLINTAHIAKNNIVTSIREKITGEIHNPFEELERIDAEIYDLDAKIRANENAGTIYSNTRKKTDFELFYTFYDGYQKKKKKNNEEKGEKNNLLYDKHIRDVAKIESQNIARKIKQSAIWCIPITILTTVIDAFLLYEPFSIGNIGDTWYTIFTCIIFAFFLDILPYALGLTFNKMRNSQKTLVLKRNVEPMLHTQNEEKENRTSVWIFVIVLILTLAIFGVYIFTRWVLFEGGGDFTIGWNMIFHKSLVENLNLEDIEHNFSDISLITPIASSLFSFVFSWLVTKTELDYVDTFIAKIKKALSENISKCETEIGISGDKKKALETQKENEKIKLWSKYYGIKPMPDNKETFISEIIAAVHEAEIKKYSGIYENFCRQARSSAVMAINTLKTKLSSYCNKPNDVLNMTITDDEATGLDYIWNITENAKQLQQTEADIDMLENHIEDIMSRWEKPVDDAGDVNDSENNDGENNDDNTDDDDSGDDGYYYKSDIYEEEDEIAPITQY